MHILAFETHILALWSNIYIHTNHLNHSIGFIRADRFLIQLLIGEKNPFRLQSWSSRLGLNARRSLVQPRVSYLAAVSTEAEPSDDSF